MKILSAIRDQSVEGVLAYNQYSKSYDSFHDSESNGTYGRNFNRLPRQDPHGLLGAMDNPHTPSKESPPNLIDTPLSIDILA